MNDDRALDIEDLQAELAAGLAAIIPRDPVTGKILTDRFQAAIEEFTEAHLHLHPPMFGKSSVTSTEAGLISVQIPINPNISCYFCRHRLLRFNFTRVAAKEIVLEERLVCAVRPEIDLELDGEVLFLTACVCPHRSYYQHPEDLEA